MAMTAKKRMWREVCRMTFAPVRVNTLLFDIGGICACAEFGDRQWCRSGARTELRCPQNNHPRNRGRNYGDELYHRGEKEKPREIGVRRQAALVNRLGVQCGCG